MFKDLKKKKKKKHKGKVSVINLYLSIKGKQTVLTLPHKCSDSNGKIDYSKTVTSKSFILSLSHFQAIYFSLKGHD